jgi:hypothetical protein
LVDEGGVHAGTGVFAGARLPSAAALRGGAGEDDERDATELD